MSAVGEQHQGVLGGEVVGGAFVLDEGMRPKEVEDAEELARSAGGRADELEDDDINALRKAAQEKLGDELPAAR